MLRRGGRGDHGDGDCHESGCHAPAHCEPPTLDRTPHVALTRSPASVEVSQTLVRTFPVATAARHRQGEAMIEIRNVTKWYGECRVLDGCSATVARGSVVVVCGPSGSGKSTLLRCINRLESIDSGEIFVDGVSVGAPDVDLSALRARLGMVFQTFEIFPHRTALENVDLAQVTVLGRRRQAATERSMALLERVGLADHARKYPSALSGGQQQRVAIARALAMDPVA